METAEIAESLSGDKLYQQRARKALPILVRQALAGTPITYEDLADELAMPNPRNLNYVLGSIGTALGNLAEEWEEEVPPVQCLVVNKTTRLPGEGIAWFLSDLKTYKKLPIKQKRQVVQAELIKIYSYKHWLEVLKYLGLKPDASDFNNLQIKATRGYGGEGPEHKALKEFISTHPESVGISEAFGNGEEEHPLPSGDSIDVLFQKGSEQIAVEVKPASSGEADIVRGLYQCIKYVAVLEARQSVERKPQNARAILALGGKFPRSLVGLRNMLGVSVCENVSAVAG